MTIAAYFYPGSKKRPATLDIERLANGERTSILSVPVQNKREARILAGVHGAQPWNF